MTEERKGNYVKIEGTIRVDKEAHLNDSQKTPTLSLYQSVIDYACLTYGCTEAELPKILLKKGRLWVVQPPDKSIFDMFILIPLGGGEDDGGSS